MMEGQQRWQEITPEPLGQVSLKLEFRKLICLFMVIFNNKENCHHRYIYKDKTRYILMNQI